MSHFKSKKGPFTIGAKSVAYVSYSTIFRLDGIDIIISAPTKDELKSVIKKYIPDAKVDVKKFKKSYLFERKTKKLKKLGLSKK